MKLNSKFYFGVTLATLLLLMIPLIAMQFTNEVNWNLSDFIFAGVLIFGTGIAYKLVTNKKSNYTYKIAIGLSLGTAFIIIWSNLAVGIIGSEDNPANLMYFVVLAVGIIGAFISQFKPKGMALTMFVVTIAIMIVPVIAFFIWKPGITDGILSVLAINAFFALLFLTSALLFRHANRILAN